MTALRPHDPNEVEQRMPLIEHLKELRYRVMVSGGAVFVGMLVGMVAATDIYQFLRAPIQAIFLEEPENRWDRLYLQATAPIRDLIGDVHVPGSLNIGGSPLEGMYAWLHIGLLAGAVLAAPIIAYQAWAFVAPGLYATERRLVIPLSMASTFLFLLGASFCYVVIFPVSFPFFLQALEASAIISVQGYLQAIVWMMLGFGACFQLPVGVWFLSKLGLVDHWDMIHGFRYATVGIVIVAAIMTPPDVITQILLSIPLLALYAVGIVVSYFTTTKQR